MSLFLHLTGVALVLSALVRPIASFSRGASHASCQEMTPGHIRAHPLDPLHSHVSIRTSTSFYLPGQLITVTVRSSRDFMGFLLQPRRVGVMRSRVGGGSGIRPMKLGPLLVGGSWVLIPPGTHTLRCLSDGDTVTHSDKQLKRNLSFVWKAPDTPMGDIRFQITVVQSYFVYWAGVESAVVHDGSRSGWKDSNTTEVDEQTTVLARHGKKVTALPGHRASKTQTYRTRTSAPTLGHPTGTGSGTQINKPVDTVTDASRPVLESDSSVTEANQRVVERNTVTTGGSRSKTPTIPLSLSGMSKETVFDPGLYTQNPKKTLPFTPFVPPTDAGHMDVTNTPFQNITQQISTSSLPLLNYLVSFFPLKHVKTESIDAKINSQEPKLITEFETKDKTLTPETTTGTLLINHSVHKTNTQRPTYRSPRGPFQLQQGSGKVDNQNKSEEVHITMSTIKVERGPLFQTSSAKPFLFPSATSKKALQSQTDKGQTSPVSKVFSPKSVLSSKTPTLQSFSVSSFTQTIPLILKTVRQYEKSPQNSPLLSTTALHFPEVLVDPIHTTTQAEPVFPQTDQSQAEKPSQTSSTSPQSSSQSIFQTGTTTQSSVNPLPVSTLFLTSRFDPVFTMHKDLKSRVKIRTTSSVSDFRRSTTPSPPLLTSTHFDSSSFPSSDSLNTFSAGQATPTIPLHLFENPVVVSMGPSISLTFPIHSSSTSPSASSTSSSSSSSSSKNQLKTPPALSGLPFPVPVSMPPHLPSVQPSSSSSYLSPLFTSFTVPSLPSSPSSPPLFSLIPASTSSSPRRNSSQCITNSTFSSLSSSSATPPSLSSSSSSASISLASSPTSSPPTFASTYASTPSSSVTSPHPGLSPAPRRSLHTPLKSSVSSHKIPVGQTLPIPTHITSSNPKPNLNPSTQRMAVHPNPKPFPNLRVNHGLELKPNIPKTDMKAKRPPSHSETPDKEWKYPDIIPRHSAWELGMLLGCSAGLGMALVVGVRYVYRKACGRRTDVTLNDREREYGRGERGLIQVEECGDLVRVRKIRENSFVLLTEYDVMAPPGS